MITTAWNVLDRPATTAVEESYLSIVLVSNNPRVRASVASVVSLEPGFRVVATSAAHGSVTGVFRFKQPDVVLLDSGLGVTDSISLCAMVRAEAPAARILVIVGPLASHGAVASYIRAGASGFVMQDASCASFLEAIHLVHAGAEILPEALTGLLFEELNTHRPPPIRSPRGDSRLTSRENEVVMLVTEGLSNQEIASRLNIAVHTVKSHVHNVLEKLVLRSRLQLAAFALRGGRTEVVASQPRL